MALGHFVVDVVDVAVAFVVVVWIAEADVRSDSLLTHIASRVLNLRMFGSVVAPVRRGVGIC